MMCASVTFFFFFFNDTATTEIYTLSLHDALPISIDGLVRLGELARHRSEAPGAEFRHHVLERLHDPVRGLEEHERPRLVRSEEHTSELQSQSNLVCRLLLEKKKTESNSVQDIQLN